MHMVKGDQHLMATMKKLQQNIDAKIHMAHFILASTYDTAETAYAHEVLEAALDEDRRYGHRYNTEGRLKHVEDI